MNTLKIKGIEGRSLPLVHSGGTPMPTTEAGKEYVVPFDAYYVSAWRDGDVECAELDDQHPAMKKARDASSKKTKAKADSAPDKGEK